MSQQMKRETKRIILQPDNLLIDGETLDLIRAKVAHDLKEDGVAVIPGGIKIIYIDEPTHLEGITWE